MNEIIMIIIRDDRKAMNLLPVKPDNFPMCSCPPEIENIQLMDSGPVPTQKIK